MRLHEELRTEAGYRALQDALAAAGSDLPTLRPRLAADKERQIREQLAAGHGIVKVANLVGVGSGTVQRIKLDLAA